MSGAESLEEFERRIQDEHTSEIERQWWEARGRHGAAHPSVDHDCNQCFENAAEDRGLRYAERAQLTAMGVRTFRQLKSVKAKAFDVWVVGRKRWQLTGRVARRLADFLQAAGLEPRWTRLPTRRQRKALEAELEMSDLLVDLLDEAVGARSARGGR